MKRTGKKLLVILAILMCFAAAQNVSAGTDFSGTIDSISTRPNVIVLDDGTAINGVKVDYLCNKYLICLDLYDEVFFTTYEYVCSDGTIKNMATSITVGDVTVELREEK